MKISEWEEGDYLISAGAEPAAGGGFFATLTVYRIRGIAQNMAVAFEKRTLRSEPHKTEDLALIVGVSYGQHLVRAEPERLKA